MLHAQASEMRGERSREQGRTTAKRLRPSESIAPPLLFGNQARLRRSMHGAAGGSHKSSAPPLQRKCACGGKTASGECPACKVKRGLAPAGRSIQSSFHVNDPRDAYEIEADQLADRVMTMSSPAASGDQARLLQMHSTSDGSACGSSHAVRNSLGSPGRPLDAATRRYFEPRFGHDFGAVRVHTDSKAALSARAVNAHAYTAGQDIVFDTGKYEPLSATGRRLLAHELTHVIQQNGTDHLAPAGRISALGSINSLQRTTVDVQKGCPGTAADITTAVTDAATGIKAIANAKARECVQSELDKANIVCDSSDEDTCGDTRYIGKTINIHKWGGGCPSLPALLVHEAAHKCKIFGTEKFSEACENEAFGGKGATAPEPGEEGGVCEL